MPMPVLVPCNVLVPTPGVINIVPNSPFRQQVPGNRMIPTHYVRSNGSNSGSGDANNPWKTIEYAVNPARTNPGDVIEVMDSAEYFERVSVGNDFGGDQPGGLWKVVQAAAGQFPSIRGISNHTNADQAHCITLWGTLTMLEFIGFDIRHQDLISETTPPVNPGYKYHNIRCSASGVSIIRFTDCTQLYTLAMRENNIAASGGPINGALCDFAKCENVVFSNHQAEYGYEMGLIDGGAPSATNIRLTDGTRFENCRKDSWHTTVPASQWRELKNLADRGVSLNGSKLSDGHQFNGPTTGVDASTLTTMQGVFHQDCHLGMNAENGADHKNAQGILYEGCVFRRNQGNSGITKNPPENTRGGAAFGSGSGRAIRHCTVLSSLIYDNCVGAKMPHAYQMLQCTSVRNQYDYTGSESAYDPGGLGPTVFSHWQSAATGNTVKSKGNVLAYSKNTECNYDNNQDVDENVYVGDSRANGSPKVYHKGVNIRYDLSIQADLDNYRAATNMDQNSLVFMDDDPFVDDVLFSGNVPPDQLNFKLKPGIADTLFQSGITTVASGVSNGNVITLVTPMAFWNPAWYPQIGAGAWTNLPVLNMFIEGVGEVVVTEVIRELDITGAPTANWGRITFEGPPVTIANGARVWRGDGQGNARMQAGVWDYFGFADTAPPPAVPAAPTNVTATPLDQQNNISFSLSAGATAHNIYWATSPGVTIGNGVKIPDIQSPYPHAPIINGQPYYYIVTAENATGESQPSVEVSATPEAPAVGSVLQDTFNSPDGTDIRTHIPDLSPDGIPWNATGGQTIINGNKMTFSSSKEEAWINAGTVDQDMFITYNTNGNATNVVLLVRRDNLAPGLDTNYRALIDTTNNIVQMFYRIAGVSTQIGADIPFTFLPNVDYSIEFSVIGTTLILRIGGVTVFTATDANVTSGTYVGFRTAALYVAPGPSFDNLNVNVVSGGIIAPQGVSATAGDTNSTISWNPVAGADSYNLYRGTSPGVTVDNGVQILNVNSPHIDPNLVNGDTYYYVVTAVQGGTESNESLEVNVTPTAVVVPPDAPTNPNASAGNTEVIIGFDLMAGADTYNMYHGLAPGVTINNGILTAGVLPGDIHQNLTNEATYYYIFTAVNEAGESSASVEVSAMPTAMIVSNKLPRGMETGLEGGMY